MTKHIKVLSGLAAMMIAAPAAAHDGDHTTSAFVNLLHWLSSPTHALIGTALGVVGAFAIYKLVKKSRA